MLSLVINALQILVLVSFKKKLSIDLIWVSPIPSRSLRLIKILFLFFKSNNFENSLTDPKNLLKFLHFPGLYVLCLLKK